MTTQSRLELAISDAKAKAMALALKYIDAENNGDEAACKNLKLVVLTNQISAMEDFYCLNFDENGNITPTFTCVPEVLVNKFLNTTPTLTNDSIEINIIDGGNA